MGKIRFTHIVISIPRLAIGAITVGILIGGTQFIPAPSQASPLHVQIAATSHPTPYTAAPQSITQPVPAPVPAETAPAPQPIVPRSVKVAPVVTPAATASVSGLTPTTPAPTPAPSGSNPGGATPPPTTTGYTSTNWSGYLAAAGGYTGIAGVWTVPKATGVGRRTSADSAWIGIGGVTTGDLIQIGTQDSVFPNGTETASAFYELLPGAAQTITTLVVTPGDSIAASLTEVSSGQWRLTISDTTAKQSYSTTVAYNSSHSSAEWIEEDPSTAFGRLIPLDVFSPVNFSTTTLTGSTGNLSAAASNAQPVTMITAPNQPVAVPSALSSDGSSFTVTHQ